MIKRKTHINGLSFPCNARDSGLKYLPKIVTLREMEKWKELIHRALLECQKIEHRQNNTKMIRITDVISKINDFLKYRNDNGEFDEICEANSKGTKVSTLLTKEVIAALFAENMYICVEGKCQSFVCYFLNFRINF